MDAITDRCPVQVARWGRPPSARVPLDPRRNMMIPSWPKRIDSGHGWVTSRNAQKRASQRKNPVTFLASDADRRECSGLACTPRVSTNDPRKLPMQSRAIWQSASRSVGPSPAIQYRSLTQYRMSSPGRCGVVLGATRRWLACSYAYAKRISFGSLNGRPKSSNASGKPISSTPAGIAIAGSPVTALIGLSRIPVSPFPIIGAARDFTG